MSSSPADHCCSRSSGSLALGRRRALGFTGSQLGTQRSKRRGGGAPSQACRGSGSLQQHAAAAGSGEGDQAIDVSRHVPCVLSQHRLSIAITGDTSVPVAEGRDHNRPRKWPGARILAQKKPSVTHLRLAAEICLLLPGLTLPVRTALLLFRSEIRVQVWIGHSLFKSKTDIRGKMPQRL